MTDSSKPLTHELVQTIDDGTLVCPNCSMQLSTDTLCCQHCNVTASDRDGVLSFLSHNNPAPHQYDKKIDAPTNVVADRSVCDTTDGIPSKHDCQSEFLSEIYDIRRDPWRVLTSEHISGRCLDLYAGFGRRSMLLAELADTVYAVDPNLSKARIAAERDDYASSNDVIPVHTTVDQLPFAAGTFDTIVANVTGKDDIKSKLAQLRDLLTDDGSLLFIADGWIRNTDLLNRIGLTESEGSGSLRPGTEAGYRALARSLGFDQVSIYALFPTSERTIYTFNVADDSAVQKLLELVLADQGQLSKYCKPLLPLLNKSGILNRCYPSYIVACSNKPKEPEFEFTEPLVISGRSRAVVLNLAESGIIDVWKIPNRTAHAPLTEQENTLLSRLQESDVSIASTLPEGDQISSRFGPVRKEQPTRGRPLAKDLNGSPQAFEHVLRTGFEWLAEFQRSFRDKDIVQSPTDLREELRFEPAGLELPSFREPVKTFQTPVHGDFLSSNIHMSNNTVTTVIDWEYASQSASPIVDAGWLLVDTATRTVGDFTEAIQTVLCGQNEYADRARECIHEYCDAVGLPYRTFEVYLPTVYLHRLKLDWQISATSTYTNRMAERTDRTQYLLDTVDEMNIS